MTGTVIVEEHSFRNMIPALAASVAASGALLAVLGRGMTLTGWRQGAMAAAIAYLAFRILYPLMSDMLPGGGRREVKWEVTRDVLVLDGEIIPRNAVRRVHVWPNRDALGITRPGLVVNIEMEGGNALFRSLTRGEEAELSRQGLEALAAALGYAPEMGTV